LYDLRYAPWAWNSKLDDTLKGMGFTQSEHEHGMYMWRSGGNILLIGVYVDDLVITRSPLTAVEEFKEEMKKVFLMSDLGLLSFYLGIEVRQEANGITLRQTHYARKILEIAGMADCKAATTPMEEILRLSRDSTAEDVDTRPDLVYLVGYVSRFLERPTEEHLQAVKKILRYIAGTLEYGLHYGQQTGNAGLVGYCNSDLVGDIDMRKRTTGDLFFLGNCLVSWQSLKQRVVALSSYEAEYIAAPPLLLQLKLFGWLGCLVNS
jgi:hypothetical protein